MRILTHGPNCKEKFAYPTNCRYCHEKVYLYGCTCGSSILFAIPYERNRKHYCNLIATEVNEYRKMKKSNKEILTLIMTRNEWTEETMPEGYWDLLIRHLGQFEIDFE